MALFPYDTEIALASTVELVNVPFETRAQLREYLDRWGFTGTRAGDDAELAQVRALGPRLRGAWTGDRDAVAALANALLREGEALPQLVTHDGWDYHLHATASDRPLAVRMAVEAAMALADVVRSDETERLRRCADSACENVFVDLSKNRSRRFCSTTCSNRTSAAAHRARRAQS